MPVLTLSELKAVTALVMTRRQRNNGVGKHLMRLVERNGHCHFEYPQNRHNRVGFVCEQVEGGYLLTLLGERHILWGRLQAVGEQLAAITKTQRARDERRRRYASGELTKKPLRGQTPQLAATAGASGNLKQHFKKTRLTFGLVTNAIAHAAKAKSAWVVGQITEAYLARGVASLRLAGGFVFRVDFAERQRLIDMNASVTLSSTNDNTHGAYRRLRGRLRKLVGCVSKVRRRAQERFLLHQRHMRRVA